MAPSAYEDEDGGGTVVDPAVLAARRVARAAATGGAEVQLAQLQAERDALAAALDDARRQLTRLRQLEESERRLRIEAQEETAEARREADARAAVLRRRLADAETRSRAVLAAPGPEALDAVRGELAAVRAEVDGLRAERDLLAVRLAELADERDAVRAAAHAAAGLLRDGLAAPAAGAGPGAPAPVERPRAGAAADAPAAPETAPARPLPGADALRARLEGLTGAPAAGGQEELARELAAAASRLRERTPPREEGPAPAVPAARIAPSPPAVAGEPTTQEIVQRPVASAGGMPPHCAAPARRPLAPRGLPARSTARPWLRDAVVALAAEDVAAAAQLVLALVPVQGLRAARALRYDLHVDGARAVRVEVAPGLPAALRPLEATDDRPDLVLVGTPEALAPLVGGGAGRRLPGLDVGGRRRWLRARLARDMRTPVSLADVARARAVPEPEMLLRALCLAARPSWVTAAATVEVEAGSRRRLVLAPGRRPVLRAPEGPVDAGLHTTAQGLPAVLAGARPAGGPPAEASGDADVLERFFELVDRVQSGA